MKKSVKKGLVKHIFRLCMVLGVVGVSCFFMSCPCEECQQCPVCEDEFTCIDFEDPILDSVYNVSEIIEDSGAEIIVQSFQWGNGTWSDAGSATVQNNGEAGGTGQEVWTNNVNLFVDFAQPVEGLTFHFGAYGGNQNLIINSCLLNFSSFDIFPTTLCGVTVDVSLVGNMGTFTLCGTIYSFAVGGQEFVVDNICIGTCE